ncbi:MAG: sulfate permease [Flavobacteriales bacterium]|nr:sulfate permease [Flavobacteriales bacterium]
MNFLKKYIPILSWLPNYKKEALSGDLSAGLTVGVMLIPQGIAYAMIAGLPPIYGLYTAMTPQVIYAIFGTSRQLSVGPTAMDSLIVAAGITSIATVNPDNYIAAAILLAFIMGLMQLAFGVCKLGFLVNFLSKPVISGFTSAAAIIIGLNQLKHIFGIEIPRSNQAHSLLYDAGTAINSTNLVTLCIGTGTILAIIFLKKYLKKLPAALTVVVISILLVQFFRLDLYGVSIIRNIPTGLPSPSIPDFSVNYFKDLLPLALTLSLIAFMEAISQAKAIEDKHNDYKVDANQELIALGLSNIVGSIFKSYPSTGGFSRTAVNDQSGAKTGMSFIIAAGLVALTLLFLTPLFYYLPKAVLGGIIIFAVLGLINIKYPIKLWRYKKDDLIMLLGTFVVTLTIGIKEGIIVGVILSLGFLIFRSTRPHIAECARIEGTDYFKNVERFDNTKGRTDVLILRFDGQLYFANINYFKDQLNDMIAKKGPNLKLIILNAEAINHMDSSAVQMLDKTIKDLCKKEIYFAVAGAIGPVRDIIFNSGLSETIGKELMFVEVNRALECLDEEKAMDFKRICKRIALQNNSNL